MTRSAAQGSRPTPRYCGTCVVPLRGPAGVVHATSDNTSKQPAEPGTDGFLFAVRSHTTRAWAVCRAGPTPNSATAPLGRREVRFARGATVSPASAIRRWAYETPLRTDTRMRSVPHRWVRPPGNRPECAGGRRPVPSPLKIISHCRAGGPASPVYPAHRDDRVVDLSACRREDAVEESIQRVDDGDRSCLGVVVPGYGCRGFAHRAEE